MEGKGLIVVTGASGFTAKRIVADLLTAGYRVRGTVRSVEKARETRATIGQTVGEEAAARLELSGADLLSDVGWAEIVAGANAVMHVASPIVASEPRDPDVVIRPAVEGTLRVLRHAHEASVRRVIVTSSVAAVGYGHGQTMGKQTYSEANFTNLEGMRYPWAYCIAKTRAEQEAWTYARSRGLALTVILPAVILGPLLDADASVSLKAVSGLLDGSTPAMPNYGICVIDVRDVAAIHVAALEKPRSIGKRYIAAGRYLWFREIADILRKAYPNRRIAKMVIPDFVMRFLGRRGGQVRQILEDIGNEKDFDGRKGEMLLGRSYIPAEEAIRASAESLIRLGLVR